MTPERHGDPECSANADSARLLPDALDATEDGLIVIDADGRIRFCNERLFEILPTTREFLQDQRAQDALEAIRRMVEDGVRFGKIVEREMAAPELTTSGEFRLTNGRIVQRISRPLRTDGRPTGRVVSVRDVTELREQERRLEQAQRLARFGSWEWDVDADEVLWSDELFEIFGVDRDSFDPSFEAYLGLIHPEDRPRNRAELLAATRERRGYEHTVRIVRPDGETRHIRNFGEPILDGDGELVRMHGVTHDVTEQEQARRRYERLFMANSAGIITARRDGTILNVNPAAAEVFGYDEPSQLEGRSVQELYRHEGERPDLMKQLEQDGELLGHSLAMQHRSDEAIEVLVNLALFDDPEEGPVVIGSFIDVTREKAMEREIRMQAFRDTLTGLPNRRLLRERGEQSLQEALRSRTAVGLLYVDISGFKRVNERLGHPFGDEVLRRVAGRLEGHVREADLVCRVGGDEFVVLAPQLGGAEDAATVADRIQQGMEAPIEHDGETVSLELAIGIALFPHHGDDLDELMSHADTALFGPDRRKSPGVRFFDPDVRTDISSFVELAEKFETALQDDQLTLHYQPVFPAGGGTPVGVEALTRWNHPDRGLITADEFIEVAESTGTVTSLDRRAVTAALRQLAAWSREEGWDGWIAVNLSVRSLTEPDLPRRMIRTLEQTETLDPSRLILEITEHAAMRDPKMAERVLRLLEIEVGVSVAIDDFGTGYSSLRYLKRFPARYLKIDMDFVDGIGNDPSDEKVIRGVISMAHEFGMESVAEGVETQEQAAWLREAGCDHLQGYLLGRPVEAAAIQLGDGRAVPEEAEESHP